MHLAQIISGSFSEVRGAFAAAVRTSLTQRSRGLLGPLREGLRGAFDGTHTRLAKEGGQPTRYIMR